MKYNGKLVRTDLEGFLLDYKQWDIGMVIILAKEENIELTDEHMEVIYFIREFYKKFNISPTMRILVKAIEKVHGKTKGNSKYLFKLFKKGPAQQAAKLAGLPKPSRCL
ncbi:sulfurtransferase [Candidatus Photodesmus katoptron]|uniref:Sulfurtransferase n=1 Tax=Candidatus Photodesmus katoptron Akat1 TaxID=1236703 RepID=S3DKE3_9GAMM|nr:TusE/DsrC/DsvC family sulfur relay protein [Candidatus Photodesmus katoptron]EPE37604.1 sulfur relay protein, TusE/DsrC/DsvC [Candidatus Photodesmus katoptron Akat1]KEY90677.1 sulfurtransferase [Candidatus Photodesmus katoptron]